MASKKKAAGMRTRAASRSYRRPDSSTAAWVQGRRSPEHWFLDGAIYARDGDKTAATLAAQRGVEALAFPIRSRRRP